MVVYGILWNHILMVAKADETEFTQCYLVTQALGQGTIFGIDEKN
jgi:hypothetical protein